MKLPEIPFTMTQFKAMNNLVNLSPSHTRLIHEKLNKMGLIQVRMRVGRPYAQYVWVRGDKVTPNLDDFRRKLEKLS